MTVEPPDAAPPRLLLVDDDRSFAAVLGRSLRRLGFRVTLAHSGAAALEAARAWEPSHALVDLKLGEESGLHLIRPLLEVNPQMRVVVLTGYGSIPTAVRAIKAGASDYLAKPVDLDAVAAALRETKDGPERQGEAARMSLRRLEWEHIQQVLEEHGGNISATARSLNMHRRTLQRKLRKRPDRQ